MRLKRTGMAGVQVRETEGERLRVMVMSGSARAGSFNRKLAALAANAARAHGAQVTEVDLRALALPIYDADLESEGQPAGALELRHLFATHSALIIAAPEYNGFPTPLLVNALDWATRPKATDGLPSGLAAVNGTVLGLMSASPTAYGGVRGLIALRSCAALTLGMLVVPATLSVPKADAAFDAQGGLVDAQHGQARERLVAAVLTTASALRAG
jgi:chromate reductase, NAD(P)H dehydrogenase (quinone)